MSRVDPVGDEFADDASNAGEAVADLIDICRAADHFARSHDRSTTAVADVTRALAQRGPRDGDDDMAETS